MEITVAELKRFWRYVAKSDACWEWTGFLNEKNRLDRYGRIWLQGRTWRANRVSWMIHFGPIPEGMHVCHKCDNPPCVRPDHLFLGTIADNARDSARKGRNVRPPRESLPRGGAYWTERRKRMGSRKGAGNGYAKLTEQQVAEIRALKGTERQRLTAARYGVHQSTISLIQNNRVWAH